MISWVFHHNLHGIFKIGNLYETLADLQSCSHLLLFSIRRFDKRGAIEDQWVYISGGNAGTTVRLGSRPLVHAYLFGMWLLDLWLEISFISSSLDKVQWLWWFVSFFKEEMIRKQVATDGTTRDLNLEIYNPEWQGNSDFFCGSGSYLVPERHHLSLLWMRPPRVQPKSMQHKSHQQGTRYDFLSISQVESYHFPQILTLHQPFISWYQQPWVETDQHFRCKGTLGSTFSWWISTWYSSITSGICRGADGEVACLLNLSGIQILLCLSFTFI